MSLLIFGSLFVVSVGAMFSLLLRRLPALRAADGETAEEVLSASVVRTYVVAWIDYGEAWYRGRAKEQFLKLLDTLLHAFEKGAGRIAGETKHVRLMVQERFRVIPRESLYWKQIHAWKKTNGNGNGSGAYAFQVEYERDISNHV